MIVVDTGVLYSYFVAEDPAQQRVAALIETPGEVCVVSPFVIAELDYLVLSRFGQAAERAVLTELLEGPYELPEITPGDLATCRDLTERYHDKALGVTDASLLVLAHRYATTRIATFDRRHFTTLRGLDDRPVELLP